MNMWLFGEQGQSFKINLYNGINGKIINDRQQTFEQRYLQTLNTNAVIQLVSQLQKIVGMAVPNQLFICFLIHITNDLMILHSLGMV
jgi:hypothetical protein